MNSMQNEIKDLSPQYLLNLYHKLKVKNKKHLESIVSAMPDLMFLVDEDGTYIDVFASGKEYMLYKPKNEIIGKHVTDFFNDELSEQFVTLINKAITSQTLQRIEYELNISNKQEFYEARVMPTHIQENAKQTVMVIVRDMTEIQLSKTKMQYLATHDALTALPNRTLIFEHLNHAITTAKRNGTRGSLLFIDIDGFKDINDNYSHKTGDTLLKYFALRLSEITRESDVVGRLSGDEFLLILENIKEMDDILNTVEKIKTLLLAPFIINERKIDITVSIGIACFPTDGTNADELIHAADQAMYNVKKNGKDSFTFYTKEFSIIANKYFFIQNALKESIKKDDFSILYQPQFSLLDGSLTGVEALLRCNHKDISDISISRIITIAEESNMIQNISHFVLQRCCKQIKEWQELSINPLKIAVNLSRKELSDDNLIEVIEQNLSHSCIDPCILEFEITESTLLQNNRSAKQNIEQLRHLGCSFSIDDYGTGFSSLSNLREFQLDKIKIDKSFIDELENNEDDRIIVSATINMIKQLGLTVLAEGVENKAQADLLKSFGCDEVQGYYYSYPLNAEAMTELLLAHNKVKLNSKDI